MTHTTGTLPLTSTSNSSYVSCVHHAPFFLFEALQSEVNVPRLQDLRDSPRRTCYFTVLGWIGMVLDEAISDSAIRTFVPSIHGHCFRWLTMPRTREEMQDIMDATCTCPETSTLAQDALHAQGVSMFRQDEGHWATLGEFFIGQCLRPLFNLGMDKTSAPFMLCTRTDLMEQRSHWPQRHAHLLPHGPETTTRALMAWVSICEGIQLTTELLCATERWMFHTGPFTQPWIATSSSLAEGLCRIMRTSLRRILVISNGDYEGVESVEVRKMITETWHRLGCLANSATILATIILAFVEPRAREFIAWDPEELLSCCSESLKCLEAYQESARTPSAGFMLGGRFKDTIPSCVEARTAVAKVGGFIYNLFPELLGTLDDTTSMISHRAFIESTWQHQCCEMQYSPSTLTFLRLHKHLSIMLLSPYCDNSRCTRTYADSNGPLRMCGGCRQVQYCSYSCQRQSWTAAYMPHRTLCNQLRYICQELDIPRKTRKGTYTLRNSRYVDSKGPQYLDKTQPYLDQVLSELLCMSASELGQSKRFRSEQEWVQEMRSNTAV